jgi:hypothetical protein
MVRNCDQHPRAYTVQPVVCTHPSARPIRKARTFQTPDSMVAAAMNTVATKPSARYIYGGLVL